MSHVTKLEGVVICSVSAVAAAVAELNAQGVPVELLTDRKPRVHGYDRVETCDYVLKLKGAYDVGLKKNAEGNYDAILDVYQGHVGNAGLRAACPLPGTAGYATQMHTQHEIGKFLQTYAKHAAMEAAMAAGHVIDSCTLDAEGNVQLVLAVA